MGIYERYGHVADLVAQQCQRVGRDPAEVRLIAVSKTVDIAGVREAYEAGAVDFGENRPDQIRDKHAALPEARWHFIGNIQSRRISDIVAASTMIHSLCNPDHVHKIDAAAAACSKIQDILIEVNVSGEASKSGFSPDGMYDVVQLCSSFEHVRLRGLMTMAPQGDAAYAQTCFERLHTLGDDLRSTLDAEKKAYFNELSMGMSEDWREAICAGATMVRIGRAIFSDAFEEAAEIQ